MTPDSADVIIIGGGIAGAAAAAELSKDRSVIVLEREDQVGLHATGRSAAITSSTSGDPAVCALAQASRDFLLNPPDGFADRPILSERGLLWVADDDHLDSLDELESNAQRIGVTTERLNTSQSRALVPTLSSPWSDHTLYEPDAMTIDVALLLDSLMRAARLNGARVITQSAVIRGERHNGIWHLETTSGDVRGRTIVNAAGAWGDEVAITLGVRPVGLQPMRRTAYMFPLDGVEGWPLVMDIGGRFYFEPEGPGLLVSPSEETHCPPHDAQPDELAIARSVDTLDEVLGVRVKGVRSKWAGLRTFAPDRRPVVGPDDAADGYFWLVGQGGAGIKTAPAMATLLRLQIDAEPVPRDLTDAGLHPDDLLVSSARRNQNT